MKSIFLAIYHFFRSLFETIKENIKEYSKKTNKKVKQEEAKWLDEEPKRLEPYRKAMEEEARRLEADRKEKEEAREREYRQKEKIRIEQQKKEDIVKQKVDPLKYLPSEIFCSSGPMKPTQQKELIPLLASLILPSEPQIECKGMDSFEKETQISKAIVLLNEIMTPTPEAKAQTVAYFKQPSNPTTLPMNAMKAILGEKKIEFVVRNDEIQRQLDSVSWQLLSTGAIDRQCISIRIPDCEQISFDKAQGDSQFREESIQKIKEAFSNALAVPASDIEVLNIWKGSYGATIALKNGSAISEKNQKDAADNLKKTFKLPEAWGIKVENKNLMNALSLSPNAFDASEDYDFEWIERRRHMRGPFPYYTAMGWKRYGLKTDKYSDPTWLLRESGKPGEWPAAFHGTGQDAIKPIYEGEFKPGAGQVHENAPNINPRNKNVYPIVGRGIYITPHIQATMQYTRPFEVDKQQYRVAFQVRVNPDNVRISGNRSEYWVCPSGTDVRPHGVLIAKQSVLDKRQSENDAAYTLNKADLQKFFGVNR